MLGKCRWKLHCARDSGLDDVDQLLRVLQKAVELVPNKRERSSDKDPILEPHYKLVSVIYKLVGRNDMSVCCYYIIWLC